MTVRDAREAPVQKVEAIIKPFKLDTVTATLRDAGVVDLTVSNVRGFGRQSGDHVDAVVSLVCRTARSQTGGNGKILVSAVEGSAQP